MNMMFPSIRITCLICLLTGVAPLSSAHESAATQPANGANDATLLAQHPAPDVTPVPPVYSTPDERPSLADAVSDTILANRVRAAFSVHRPLNESEIGVKAEDGVITLTGSAVSDSARTQAIEAAADVDGVKRVDASAVTIQ